MVEIIDMESKFDKKERVRICDEIMNIKVMVIKL